MLDPLEALRTHQDGRCAICQQRRTLVVDHDHVTGLVRGLLCVSCNGTEGTGLDYPWVIEYRATPPAAVIGLRIKYGEHRPTYPRGDRPRRKPPLSFFEKLCIGTARRGSLPEPRDGEDPEAWEATCRLITMLGRSLLAQEDDTERQPVDVPSMIASVGVDVHGPLGQVLSSMMAALAELEQDVVRQRATTARDAARRQGREGGRPTVMDADRLTAVRARRARGESPTKIARALGVSRATVYRHIAQTKPAAEVILAADHQ